MPKANPLQAALNAGELSPRMAARVDFGKYPAGCEVLRNMIPLPQGGATRRPGTRFVAAAADSGVKGRLLPFEFSTLQAYVVEAGDRRLRFFRNQGPILAEATGAAIVNGGFDDDIAGWSDRSSGAADVVHAFVGEQHDGYLAAAHAQNFALGDGINNRRHAGVLVRSTIDGEVLDVKIDVRAVTTAFDAVIRIYTDDMGSPGTQVGGDSEPVALDTVGIQSFAWSAQVPQLSAGTLYWVVLSDVSAGAGSVSISIANGQPDGAFGASDVLTDIADVFAGTARFGLRIGSRDEGVLALRGAAGATAVAEQEVALGRIGPAQVLRFRVRGLAGDQVKLRIGTASDGGDVLAARAFGTGWHSVAFAPAVSPVFIQFLNESAKSLHIDDVSLLDDEPLELPAPYGEAELPALKWAQSADVMYLAHPDRPVHKLTRSGHSAWSLVEVAWQDGPYGETNAEAARTLQPAATEGLGVTVTAAGHAPFAATDLGRLLRLKNGEDWGYGVIAEVVSDIEVRVDVRRAFAATTAAVDWALGAWSETTGFPSTVTFFEQRFAAANTRSQSQTFWLSQSADIENMRPDSLEGGTVEVQDDDALDFTIAATRVNAIRWLAPGRQLFMGTAGGEWVISSDGPVLTPSDIDVKQHASHGSADLAPARISNVALFLQRAKRKVREFSYSFESDGYRAPDLTVLADHVTQGGLEALAYQEEPDSLLWCLRSDGQLATLTYLREQDVTGWSRQFLGGRFQEGGQEGGQDGVRDGRAVVESLAVIPGNAATASENRDEVWFLVKRTIGGATRRSLEVLEGGFDGPERSDFPDAAAWRAAVLAAQKRAFFVDSGLSGSFPAPVTTIAGLDHLEGETVAVLADGAVHPERVVSQGRIELRTPAREVVVGLPYRHDFKSLKLAVGAVAGTAVGKVKRVHGVTLVLLHALDGRVGPDETALEPLVFRTVGDAMDSAVPLFSGEYRVAFPGDYDRDPRLVIQGEAPLPFTLLAIAPELQTRDVI